MKLDYRNFDPYFKVTTIERTHPKAMWMAMHQDYSDQYVTEAGDTFFDDPNVYEERLVKHLLKGDKGHFGPLEHGSITLNVGYVPNCVTEQARTHRIGVSFDVQSFRYTGNSFYTLGKRLNANDLVNRAEVERLVYLRPVGTYTDRNGCKYDYDTSWRNQDYIRACRMISDYASDLDKGKSYEHARDLLPKGYRQHFVVSFNPRSLMHFLDLRSKADAQIEICVIAHLIFDEFKLWLPTLAEWYETNRLKKALLAP